jgi:hypothetical protein
MNVNEAEDLRSFKREWLSWAGSDNGPAWGKDWYDDYQSRDEGRVRRFLAAAHDAVNDPRLQHRRDIESMASYLQIREKVRTVLQARLKAGGAGSLSANANADVAAFWSQFTAHLVSRDIVFGDVFTRSLEADDLTAEVGK